MTSSRLADRPLYLALLGATFLGGVVAWFAMIVPHYVYSRWVLDVGWDAFVGRNEDLGAGTRIALYVGLLLLVFGGFLVYAAITRSLARVFAPGWSYELWDVFLALGATAVVGAILAYWFPFLGIVVMLFGAPWVVGAAAARRG